MHWQPTATLAALRERGELLRELREFFWRRAVLEVETPLLCASAGTDAHLHSFCVQPAGSAEAFLQTSPEFAMKRLLAAGSGAIYQLGKAFRDEESGRLHNREFTLLEWYRPGFDEAQLMTEIETLLQCCLPQRNWSQPIPRISYRDAFHHALGFDPCHASVPALADCAARALDIADMQGSRDDWLHLLFSHCVEPTLPPAVFVTEFPASQAALAQLGVDARGDTVARRFELYVDGIELANGYYELSDAQEQRQRFAADNRQRQELGLPAMPVDEMLLAALAQGLPDAAGVALGVDRLLMLRMDAADIADVMAFVASNS